MADEPFFNFELNTEDLIEGIEVIDTKIEKTKEALEDLDKAAIRGVSKAISYAQMGWGVIQGVIRASGGAISMTQRLVVSAAFGAIQALTPVALAGFSIAALTKDPIMLAQAIMGIAQLTSALAALATFEAGAKDVSLQLRGLNFMFNNINIMLGSFSFL